MFEELKLKKGAYYWVKWGPYIMPLFFTGSCFYVENNHHLYEEDIDAVHPEEIVKPVFL